MIDRFIVSPTWHRGMGELVMLLAVVTAIVAVALVVRRRPMSGLARALTIGTQIGLMAQALIGIKLLDQGMGTVQLYIHYLGGLGPLLFFMLLYWFPSRDALRQTRWTALAATASVAFVVMTYTIGGLYAQGGLR